MDTEARIRIAFYVCIAVAVMFLFQAVMSNVVRPLIGRSEINRRVGKQKSMGGEQAMLALKAERGIGTDVSAVPKGLETLLIQSGLHLKPLQFLAFIAVLVPAVYLVANFFTLWPQLGKLGLAVLLGALLPLQVIRTIRKRRMKKFAEQLPDALDVIVRSLRSGHPVPVAISLVGREMADPIGTEFGITIDEMTYGLDLAHAIRNLGARVGLSDLTLLITAVSLQSQSGGNLGEVLSNLSTVLRERFQLKRKVHALSAEGRMSGWCLAILPFVIAGSIYSQNHGYYLDVLDDPKFLPVLGGLALWSVLGDIIMYKMVNFKY